VNDDVPQGEVRVNDDVPQEEVRRGAAPEMAPEDLAQLLMSAGAMPLPAPPSKGSLRSKLLVAILIAGVGVGASVMSCVGQSFSYRQARALEGIEKQLEHIQSTCAAGSAGAAGTAR